ncbi:putative SWI/SNF-related matrix-associated actin-dependent regulator of chromatin subfamily A member 3-like 1 [Daucus carota subsp. sativus]|uniref:putative SWI/SNF-related matrix-associated actin-dependent regulator of chromatin subfamily A member 3-like 1 n=1 Tax=Daucus carota subsp. sativus TaxID=79200 RepID=UPI0030835F8A
MEAICLRRTKEQGILGLPRKIMKICPVDLSAEERELYDQMEVEAKTAVQDYISSGTVRSHYIAVLGIVLRLRQTCTHMDLCPKVHIATLPCSNKEELSNNPELLKKMAAILDGSEELECPICLSAPNNIVITRCAHIYCQSCILRTLKRDRPRCPLCRHDLSESDIFSAPTEQSNAEIASSGESSRITALLKLLSEARDQDPTAKSVVFSQFRKMLILLEEPLKTAGFNVLRLDGSMIATKRAQVIKDFGVPAPNGRPTVLLASLRASSTGVDLAAANRVYLLEPWWNPEVDDQAINRVHLTGQTKDVTVVRIVARNSIEERILALQDQKRMAGPAVYKLNINDIRTLLSLLLEGPTVLLGSPKASGTGVNLAATNTLHHLESRWNPAIEEQANDRVHRIGQMNEVTIMLYRSTYIFKVITSPARSFPKEVSMQLLWWRSIQKVDGMIEIVVFRYFIIGIVLGTSLKLGFIWSSGVTVQVCKSCTVTLVVSSAGNASDLIDLVASRTTLVVSSTSVFSTCKEQLKKHTKPGKLSVYLYYEQRTKDPMELVKYDLVLTTYSLLASELESGSPVFQVPWWRVILDEAHLIKHSTPTQASAVLRLNARRRWLVTGTPLQNTTMDMYSFMSIFEIQSIYRQTLLEKDAAKASGHK